MRQEPPRILEYALLRDLGAEAARGAARQHKVCRVHASRRRAAIATIASGLHIARERRQAWNEMARRELRRPGNLPDAAGRRLRWR